MSFWKMAALAIAIVGAGVLSLSAPPASAAQGTLRVDPASQTVGAGADFTVKIIQNADIATAGAQASLRFDPAVLEVVNVVAGSPYASAQLLFPGSLETAIADANGTGLLSCVATFYVPGSGSVPPGDAEFLVITMKAKAGGSVPLRITGEGCGSNPDAPLEMLDENGSVIPVSSTDGSVTVSGAAPPPPGVTPQATPTPVGTPTTAIGTITPRTPVVEGTPSTPGTGSETALAGTPGAVVGARVYLDPETSGGDKGSDFTIEVKHAIDRPVSGISVQVRFRTEVAQLESIEPGSTWANARGAAERDLSVVAEQARQTGDIDIALQLQGETAPGEGTLVILNMKGGDKDAKTNIAFVSVVVTDAEGNIVQAESEGGVIVVGSGGGGRSAMTTLSLGTMILLVLGGTAGGAYFMVQRRRKQWAS